MQSKTIKISLINRDTCVSKHTLFEWVLVKEEKHVLTTTLYFERDDSLPYIKELEKLEFSYQEYNYLPFPLVIVLCALAFICFTVFLCIFLHNKEHFDQHLYALAFVGVGAISLIGAVLILFSRNKTAERISIEKPKQDRLYREKIKTLKEKK